MSQSTGPRTPEGKQRSSVNARKHGFSGRTLIVAEDQQADFDKFIANWETQLEPTGVLEEELFGQLINAAWTLRRISNAEADLMFESLGDPLACEAGRNQMRLLSLYQSRAERTFHKAKDELRKLQEERLFRESQLPAETFIPPLPRLTSVRREIARDNRTQTRQLIDEMEAHLNAPPPPEQTKSPEAA